MHAVIQNFRGIQDAQIQISPIALIAGHNGAGKTSIALAVAAAATGRTVPFDRLTKKDCAIMLHHGSRAGMVTLGSDDGYTSIEWPKASAQSEGRAPFASEIATGLISLLGMPKKEALAYLINLMKADVTKEGFETTLQGKGIDAEAIRIIWATIEAQGWDGALARAKEKGTKLKGAWENITGEKFGTDKVVAWRPADWQPDLDQIADVVPLINIAATKKLALENLIKKSAVNESELSAAREQVKNAKALVGQREGAEQAVMAIESELAAIDLELRENPNPDAKTEHDCPHCAGKIHIKAVSGTQYILSKAEKVDEAKLKEARLKNASLCGKQQNASTRLHEAKKALQAIEFGIERGRAAEDKLEKAAEIQDTASAEEIAAARAAVATADLRAAMVHKRGETQKIAGQFAVNATIIELLDETGIRREKLKECLGKFREEYTDIISHTLGIKSVLLDADMNVQVGKTPYQMLSGSEQFRVHIVLQLAIAQIEKSSIVIIDGADIIEPQSRGRLLQTVSAAGIPAIICMTLANPEKAPNLAQMGAGCSYWVHDGTCVPFSAPKKEAA